jgi:NAD(P)-dependent dehydrogenase (short-subunit alcohol dehydrogenase family)
MPDLSGTVALVAGATRGGSRGIAVELGRAGATVYVTGRSSRTTGRSDVDRPETIEETAELAGGIAVRVDHSRPDEVRALVERIAREQDGRLDLLVNGVWGGDPLTDWATSPRRRSSGSPRRRPRSSRTQPGFNAYWRAELERELGPLGDPL